MLSKYTQSAIPCFTIETGSPKGTGQVSTERSFRRGQPSFRLHSYHLRFFTLPGPSSFSCVSVSLPPTSPSAAPAPGRRRSDGALGPSSWQHPPNLLDSQLQRASPGSDRGTVAPWKGHFNVTLSGLAPEAGSLLPTPWCQSDTPPGIPDPPAAKATPRPAPQTRQLSDAFENGECQPETGSLLRS